MSEEKLSPATGSAIGCALSYVERRRERWRKLAAMQRQDRDPSDYAEARFAECVEIAAYLRRKLGSPNTRLADPQGSA